ncbi:putative G-protein coupled receptor 160 [Aplochiton taeniatus]
MNTSILSILLGLCGKCLLNWAIVLHQRKNILRSFIGVLSLSLSLIDTLMTLSVTTLHIQRDAKLMGIRVTRHHICMSLQIVGQTYNALHWPVLVLACLDHNWALSRRLESGSIRAAQLINLVSVSVLWTGAILYVFLFSGFLPVLGEDNPSLLHQCWLFSSTWILVTMVLYLIVVCAVLYVGFSTHRGRDLRRLTRNLMKTQTEIKYGRVQQVLGVWLSNWAVFLVFICICLMVPVEIPAHLGLNVPWLCFLNSFLIGVASCSSATVSQTTETPGLSTIDSFCDWELCLDI